MRIPYDFSSTFTKDSYTTFLSRIQAFSNVSVIGQDASGTYDMHQIKLGNLSKSPVMIMAGLHGNEWQGSIYSMRFMEELRDNTFPDTAFRNRLLSQFHIVYLPLCNPYGYDNSAPNDRSTGRLNFNGVDLNRDFTDETQAETLNIKAVMDSVLPFSFMDIHMFAFDYDAAGGKNLILGNGHSGTKPIRDLFELSWQTYANDAVHTWGGASTTDLARGYAQTLPNPHTPYTLSYISELYRPSIDDTTGEIVRTLSDAQIMKYGMGSIYLFLELSMRYYRQRKMTLREVHHGNVGRFIQN